MTKKLRDELNEKVEKWIWAGEQQGRTRNEMWAETKTLETGAQWMHDKLMPRTEQLAVRVEGMILSLVVHGTNINLQFHIDWLQEALQAYKELMGEK